MTAARMEGVPSTGIGTVVPDGDILRILTLRRSGLRIQTPAWPRDLGVLGSSDSLPVPLSLIQSRLHQGDCGSSVTLRGPASARGRGNLKRKQTGRFVY